MEKKSSEVGRRDREREELQFGQRLLQRRIVSVRYSRKERRLCFVGLFLWIVSVFGVCSSTEEGWPTDWRMMIGGDHGLSIDRYKGRSSVFFYHNGVLGKFPLYSSHSPALWCQSFSSLSKGIIPHSSTSNFHNIRMNICVI